jgi:hypothetical protein
MAVNIELCQISYYVCGTVVLRFSTCIFVMFLNPPLYTQNVMLVSLYWGI